MIFHGHFTTPLCEPAGREAGRGMKTLCLTIFFLLTAVNLIARPGEYEVKAAFLFNFARFVEWPAKALVRNGDPIVIGIVGDDPFGDALLQIAKEQTAQGRKIEIRYYKADEDCSASHLLFLSRSVAAQTEEILQRLQGRPILTVSEKEGFVRQGGVIEFALVEKTVRFDINATIAMQVGLKVSSKLLAVARSVINSS